MDPLSCTAPRRTSLTLWPARGPRSRADTLFYRLWLKGPDGRIRGSLAIPRAWLVRARTLRESAHADLDSYLDDAVALADEMFAALPVAVQHALEESTGRVDLNLRRAPHLASLPWELIGRSGSLVLSERFEIGRRLAGRRPRCAPGTAPTVLLLVGTTAGKTGALDVRHDLLDVVEALQAAGIKFDVAAGADVIVGHDATRTVRVHRCLRSADDVFAALGAGHSIVHIIASSDAVASNGIDQPSTTAQTLRLDLADGSTLWLPIVDLQAAFARRPPRLVVLHACQPREELAAALGVEHVVGVFGFAPPRFCAAWCPAFYNAIRAHRSISEAMRRARSALRTDDRGRWAPLAWLPCHWPRSDGDRPFANANERKVAAYRELFALTYGGEVGHAADAGLTFDPIGARSVVAGRHRQRRLAMLATAVTLARDEKRIVVPVYLDLRKDNARRLLAKPAAFAEAESGIKGLAHGLREEGGRTRLSLLILIDDPGARQGDRMAIELAQLLQRRRAVRGVVVGRRRANVGGLPDGFAVAQSCASTTAWVPSIAIALTFLLSVLVPIALLLWPVPAPVPARVGPVTKSVAVVRLGVARPAEEAARWAFVEMLEPLQSVRGLALVHVDEAVDALSGGEARARQIALARHLDGLIVVHVNRPSGVSAAIVHLRLIMADTKRHLLAADRITIDEPIPLADLLSLTLQRRFAQQVANVALCILAAARFERGQYAAAREAWQQARGHVLDTDAFECAQLELHLGRAWIAERRPDEARAHLAAALRHANAVPRDHPLLAPLLGVLHGTLGVLHQSDRRFDEADRAYSAAVPLLEAALPSHATVLATVLGNRALARAALGRFAEATADTKRAVAVSESATDVRSAADVTLRLLLTAANIAARTDQPERARDAVARATEIAMQSVDHEQQQRALALCATELADVLQELGCIEEADAACRQAIATWESATVPAGCPARAIALAQLHERRYVLQPPDRRDIGLLDRALYLIRTAVPCPERELAMASLLVNRARHPEIANSAQARAHLVEATRCLGEVPGQRSLRQIEVEALIAHTMAMETFVQGLRDRRSLPSFGDYGTALRALSVAIRARSWSTAGSVLQQIVNLSVIDSELLAAVCLGTGSRSRLRAILAARGSFRDRYAEAQLGKVLLTLTTFAGALDLPSCGAMANAAEQQLRRAIGQGANLDRELEQVAQLRRGVAARRARPQPIADTPDEDADVRQLQVPAADWPAVSLVVLFWMRLIGI